MALPKLRGEQRGKGVTGICCHISTPNCLNPKRYGCKEHPHQADHSIYISLGSQFSQSHQLTCDVLRNVPIFMPEHLPKYLFQQGHESYDHRWAGRRMDPRTQTLWPDTEESPFEERSIDAVHRILQFSDYFRFPHVQYFASIPDLLERLPQSDFVEISHSMAAFNQDALIETGATWRRLLDSVL
ncbi:unnamed protein product [Effrenium voratum]|uniref:Uncharacterized protein n=1 Tax=Effrenium voratum TaxID=2562239 RepID=A0AA36I527_9DINO|nr:unnamed protein product [Effrenium voratum]CAJ1381177.1 unnamed protein product [Effrenium voratum]CAJ1430899.1 unnamed protein product [Effrenium voratum]